MNAAHLGGSGDHHVRFGCGQKALCLLLPLEIDFIAAGRDDLASHVREPAQDRGTDHTAMAGDVDLLADEIEQLGGHRMIAVC